LVKLGSPKIKKGLYHIYTEGVTNQNYRINSFRRNPDYANRVANKYNMYIKPNKLRYLQPFLKDA